MSFVNLLADDVWSGSDIDNRVQALIRSQFTISDELKAARLARKQNPSEGDLAFLAMVDAVISAAVAEGTAAREDMAKLLPVLDFEKNQREAQSAHDRVVSQNAFEREQYEAEHTAWVTEEPAPVDPPTPEYEAELAAWRAREPQEPVPQPVPELIPDPIQGDPIFQVWSLRHPVPVTEPEQEQIQQPT